MKKGFAQILLVVVALIGLSGVFIFKKALQNKTQDTTIEETVLEPTLSSPSATTKIFVSPSPSETIVSQLDFVSSTGIRKKLTVLNTNDGNGFSSVNIYIHAGSFDKEKSRRVNFTMTKEWPYIENFLNPILESPGQKKYFFAVMHLGGDFGKSAIFDEDAVITSENIDDNVYKFIEKKYGEKYLLARLEKTRWIDSNTISARYAAYADHNHEFQVKLSTYGEVLEVEKVNL